MMQCVQNADRSPRQSCRTTRKHSRHKKNPMLRVLRDLAPALGRRFPTDGRERRAGLGPGIILMGTRVCSSGVPKDSTFLILQASSVA